MTLNEKIQAYTHFRLFGAELEAFEQEIANDPVLQAEVAAVTAVQKAMVQAAEEMPENGWERLSTSIASLDPLPANDNRPIRFSLLQVACIALVTAFGWQVVGAVMFPREPASYTTVSTDTSEYLVQVVFRSTTALSDVTQILEEMDGRIVDGPSALGLFSLAFSDIVGRDAAFNALEERSDIVSEITKN